MFLTRQPFTYKLKGVVCPPQVAKMLLAAEPEHSNGRCAPENSAVLKR